MFKDHSGYIKQAMRIGQYIKQLSGDLEYKAFVPNELPFNIRLNDALQTLLTKAHSALGRLDGVSEVVPDVNFFVRMYVNKEATLSSQVEGTQATLADVLKAEAKIKEEKAPSDVKEILNYIAAMNYGLKRLDEFPLSLRLIREIHEILLKNVRGMERMPGEFRTSQNWIGGTTINNASFVPTPPQELSRLLDNLEKFLHDKSPMPSLIKIGIIHSQFENIHPFLDGNGRIGRLLITFYLWQQKELSKPLLYLSAFFKKHRQEYYNRLHAVHESDDIEGWLEFFFEGIVETSAEAIETARKILKLREEDTRKVAELGRVSKHGLTVFEHLFRDPIITLKHIMAWTSLSKSNAYNLLQKLTKAGLLKFAGKTATREKVYYYQKYYHLFD